MRNSEVRKRLKQIFEFAEGEKGLLEIEFWAIFEMFDGIFLKLFKLN